MIDLNRLISKFEKKLEILAIAIHKFWKTLIQEKQSFEIYNKGLKISHRLNSLSDLYEDIQDKQGENKEIKVNILMSGFYKYVVFKPQECMQEIQKSRQVYQIKKIRSLTNDTDLSSDKGIIITNLDFKQPMQVDFINKSCSKLIQYNQNEIQGLLINQLMPQIIGEYHNKFLEKFMATGKSSMLNQRKEQFIKKKDGYLLPVISYLCINSLQLSNLILIIEPNTTLSFIQEDNENSLVLKGSNKAFMIADNILRMYEMTEEVPLLSKLSKDVLSQIKQNTGIQPEIDDLFQITNQSGDISSLIKEGVREFQVIIKSEIDIHIQECILNEEAKIANLSSQQNSEIYQQKSKTLNQLKMSLQEKQQQYTMRIISESYMNGGLQIYIIALTLQRKSLTTIEVSHNSLDPQNRKSMNQSNKVSVSTNPNQEAEDLKADQNKSEDLLEADMGQYELSSQTSTASSSDTNTQKLDQFSSSLRSQNIPMTLKFILQIILAVFIIIIVTSSVSLTLTLSNTSETREGLITCRQAVKRLNRITSIRVVYRQIFNIAQNYVPNTSEAAPDRFTLYSRFLRQLLEELRVTQFTLQKYDSQVDDFQSLVRLKFLMEDNSVIVQERDLGQAINLFVNKADDLIQRGLKYGKQYFASKQYFLAFSNDFNLKSTLVERDAYFIIENGNQDLFKKVLAYAQMFNQISKDKIEEKVYYTSTMTWICIGIICLCGLISIPLFSRIQSRIFMLMKIFFDIDKQVVKEIQEKLIKFENLIKPAGQQEDQYIDTKRNNDLESIRQLQINQMSKINQNKELGYDNQSISEKVKIVKGKGEEVKMEIKDKNNDEIDEIDQSLDLEEVNERLDKAKIKKIKKLKREDIKNLENTFDKIVNEDVSQSDQQNSQVKFFNRQINRRKLRQSIFIILVTIAFNAYFLGTYLMNTQTFDEAAQSINLIFTMQLKRSCVENVIHSTTETILFNRTYLINDDKDEIQSYFDQFCSKIETTYLQKVQKNRPSYFDRVYPFLDMLESGDYCQKVFGDSPGDDGFQQAGTQMDYQTCMTISNGISSQGMSQLYQLVYQITTQVQLEYASQYKKDKAQNITLMIQLLQKPVHLFDVVEVLFQKPNRQLIQTIQDSLDQYFQKKALNFTMIYFVFIFITVVSISAFLLSKCYFIDINFFQRYSGGQ
eukprot:403355517